MSLLILHYIIGILEISLGVFVVLRRNRTIIHWIFLALCFTMGIWSIFNGMVMGPDLPTAWALRAVANSMYISGYIISALVLLFFAVFPTPPNYIPLLRIGWVSIMAVALAFFIIFTGHVVYAVDPLNSDIISRIRLNPRGFGVYSLLFLLNMLVAVWSFFRHWYRSAGLQKKQLTYVGIGLFVSLVLGAFFDVVLPLFGVMDFVIYSALFLIPFLGFSSYAILRYRLLEIDILVKRATLYIIVVGIVAGLYAFLLMIPQGRLNMPGNEISILIMMVTAIVIALTLQPLRDWLDKVTDKVFFQSRYNYQNVLEKISREISTVVKLEDMLDMVAATLLDTMHINRVGIYLRGQFGQPYFIAMKRAGTQGMQLPGQLEEDHILAEYINEHKDVLVRGEFIHRFGHLVHEKPKQDNAKGSILQALNTFFQAEVVVPLWLKNVLTGMIVLGEKKGGDSFTGRDISLLETISNQMVVVLENTRLYEQMLNSERLTVLGAMAASIAHEIRNPLAAIKTFIQMLPGKYEQAEFRARFHEIIPGEIDRLTRITEDLLTFARPSPPALVPTDVNAILQRVLTLLANQIRKRELAVHTELGEVPEIQADGQQLTQVFMNLILNAIQASQPGRTITVKSRLGGEVEKGPRWQRLEVSVHDQGHGIKAKDLPYVFQPYFTTKHEGTGLGLATCKRIVEAHHGDIFIDSVEDHGAIFSVVLPMVPVEQDDSVLSVSKRQD